MSQGLMNLVFVQIRCKPGTAYQVADVLYEREICSSLYSTSGEWDLLAKIYPPKDADVGKSNRQRFRLTPVSIENPFDRYSRSREGTTAISYA